LILGLTFKENCPDLRNTKVVDLVSEFEDYGAQVDVHDPWVDPEEAQHEYGITPVSSPKSNHYNAVVLAVAHHQFAKQSAADLRAYTVEGGILYDIKALLAPSEVDGCL
jgi:UDP-N-acetyl-D-galactosamine dehydrogenase